MGAARHVFVLLFVTIVAGCVEPQVRRTNPPADWPRIVPSSTCDALAGAYVNRSVSTTLQDSQSLPWLSSLMENGGVRWSSDVAGISAESVVSITVAPVGVSVSRKAPLSPATQAIVASSECLDDGSLQLRFPPVQGGGEAAITGASNTVVYLYAATGNELLIKRVGRSHGLTFPAVPYDVTTEVWFRFRRVVPPAL